MYKNAFIITILCVDFITSVCPLYIQHFPLCCYSVVVVCFTMQSNDVAKKELKRQSKKEMKRRSSVNADAAEFQKNNKNGQWSEDVSVKKCMRCEKSFSLTLRR